MDRRRGPTVDGFGRLLSALAIVVGLGGGFYFYQENQTLKAELNALSDPDAESTVAAATEFNKKWDEQLRAELDKFKLHANEILTTGEVAISDQQKMFKDELVEVLADREDLSQLKRRVEDIQDIVTMPRLSLAEVRMRPNADDVAATALGRAIANNSPADAIITAARFKTRKNAQFKVKAPMSMEPMPNSLVFDFSMKDNNAKTLGRHRDYERSFADEGKFIPASRTVNVLVHIKNASHVGWGWQGDLELEYGKGRSITIPGVRAVFVADEIDSI